MKNISMGKPPSERRGLIATLKDGDRIYKVIEARTVGSMRKNFISKIDKNGLINVLTIRLEKKISREMKLSSTNR